VNWQGERKKLALVSNVATVIKPKATIECLGCLPLNNPRIWEKRGMPSSPRPSLRLYRTSYRLPTIGIGSTEHVLLLPLKAFLKIPVYFLLRIVDSTPNLDTILSARRRTSSTSSKELGLNTVHGALAAYCICANEMISEPLT
jgi:hypothetical protein